MTTANSIIAFHKDRFGSGFLFHIKIPSLAKNYFGFIHKIQSRKFKLAQRQIQLTHFFQDYFCSGSPFLLKSPNLAKNHLCAIH